MQERRPTVVVWRSLWLPPSETFVRDHVAGLRRWDALTLGLYRQENGLGVVPDVAPFTRRGPSAWLVPPLSRVGYPGVYDLAIRRRHPSVVHAHFGTGATEVLPVARRHRLPMVVTFHGHDVFRAPQEDPSGRYRRRLAKVFDYADRLLPVSRYAADGLVRLGAPQEKISVHHLGIPLSGRQHEPLRPQADRDGVAFVGRLIPLKGVADLLTAWSLLPAATRSTTPLRIAGEGPELPRLRQLASEIPGASIEFLGLLPPEEARRLMERSAVVVAPSKHIDNWGGEAFGLVLVEAALAGTPVVSYASGGVPEAVVDGVTGLLAPEGDTAALAQHIQRLLDDRQLAARLGSAGHQRVVEQFDAATQTALLEDLYDELAATALRRGERARRG